MHWRIWLRGCVTSQKVADPIPDGVSASNRNDYRWYLLRGRNDRCVGLTTVEPSCAECLEIQEASTFYSPKDLPMPLIGYLHV